jgi:hypothetical protein
VLSQGINSAFSLHLNDDFGIFSIEPEKAIGSTAVTVRVTNHTLDYEDPNQRKFFLLVNIIKEHKNVPTKILKSYRL